MKILRIKFASKLSLLLTFVLFLVVVAGPAFYYRTVYAPEKIASSNAILFAVIIMGLAIALELLVGIVTTYWFIENDVFTIKSKLPWLLGKSERSFYSKEIASVRMRDCTNKFASLTIVLVSGEKIRLYHSVFNNDKNFRQLGRILRRSISKRT